MAAHRPWGERTPIGDGVVAIEPFTDEAVPAMMAWNADVEARRRFDWPAPLPPAEHDAHCRAVIARWQADWEAGRLAAFMVREVADVAVDNDASRRVSEQAGFTDTGERFESEPVAPFRPEISAARTMARYALTP